MEIGDVTKTAASAQAGLPQAMENMVKAVRDHDEKIRADISGGLKPNSELMTLPAHIQQQFQRWDQEFTSPQERKLVQALKNRITEITLDGQQYIRDRAVSNTEKVKLELAIKACSKTTSGIQQLLSAQ